MSRPKSKVQELVEQVLMVAGVVDVAARTMSAAAGWIYLYYGQASVDDQLEHLRVLVVMLHSVVEEAERVGIRGPSSSSSLGRWLSIIHDAALDGDDVLRSFPRQRRLAMHSAKPVVIIKSFALFRRVCGRDTDQQKLSRTVARLDKVSSGTGRFLKLLKSEAGRSSSRVRPQQPPLPPPPADGGGSDDNDDASPPPPDSCWFSRMDLTMVLRNIWHVLDRFTAPPTWRFLAPPEPDTERLRVMACTTAAHNRDDECSYTPVRSFGSSVATATAADMSVDDQLERLAALLVVAHSAVDEAERVRDIASWWLRRWLWRLRYAALDGDEVLRSLRHRQRAAGGQAAGTGNTLWRSAKTSLLFAQDGGADDGTVRLSRMLMRLERETMGIGDFLKLLDLETRRRSLPAPQLSSAFQSDPTAGHPLAAAAYDDDVDGLVNRFQVMGI